MVTIIKERRDFIDPRRFGAKMDAEIYGNVVVNNSAVVTNTVDAPFRYYHLGKTAWLSAGTDSKPTAVIIVEVISATQVRLNTSINVSTTTRMLIGTDDTVAVKAAMDYAVARSRAMVLDGFSVISPTLMKSHTGIIGVSRDRAGLFLKPGSATVNKYLLKNSDNDDHHISVEDVTLNGLRQFHRNSSNALLYDIDLLLHDGHLGAVDVYNRYANLMLRESNRATLKHVGKGHSVFSDIISEDGTYGIEINAPDITVSGLRVKAFGTAITLGSAVARSQFSNCKATFSGVVPMPGGLSGAGESACWFINGASDNQFSGCEGQQSWADVWFLNGAHRNKFAACSGVDAGSIYPVHTLGSSSLRAVMANWYLKNSNDNLFSACNSGTAANGTANHATHALYAEGNCSDNQGHISIDRNSLPYSTGRVGRGHTGVRNSLTIGDEPLDANDPSHIDNQRFLTGSLV